MPLIFLADFFLEIFVRFIIKIRPVDVKDFSVINAKFLHSIKSVCFMFRQFTATHSIVIAVVYLNQCNLRINIRYMSFYCLRSE